MTKPATNKKKNIASKGTDHVAVALAPDVCLVPPKNTPAPFPNWVLSSKIAKDQTTFVFLGWDPLVVSTTEWGPPSEPAHAGTAGGQTSHAYRGPAMALSYSLDLFVEGRAAVRQDDFTMHNLKGDTPNTIGHVVDAADLVKEIQKATGRAVPQWCAQLSGNTKASKRMIDSLARTQKSVNAVGATRSTPISVSQAEIAANAFGEGVEKSNVIGGAGDHINGYESIGIDSMLDPKVGKDGNYHVAPEYSAWIDDTVGKSFAPDQVGKGTNDAASTKDRKTVACPTNMTIEQAIRANAGLYAANKAKVAQYMTSNGVDFSKLPEEAQFYWSAISYNGGYGTFQKLFDAKGVDQWKDPWPIDEGWGGRFNDAANAKGAADKMLAEAQKQHLTGPALQGFVNGQKKAAEAFEKVKNEGGPWYPGKQAHFNILRRLAGYKYMMAACMAAAG